MSTGHTHTFRLRVVALGVLLFGGVLGGGAYLFSTYGAPADSAQSGAASDAKSTPSPTADGAPQSGQAADDATVSPEVQNELSTRLGDIQHGIQSALAEPEGETPLTDVLVGEALQEHTAIRDQFRAEGIQITGDVTLSDVQVLSATDSEARISVCYDSSALTVADGGTATVDVTPGDLRSRVIVTLVREDGVWKLAEETFAEDPTC